MSEHIVVVTGTSSGIGNELVRLLLDQNEIVLRISRSSDKFGDEINFFQQDLALPLENTFKKIESRLNEILNQHSSQTIILINNAGTLGNVGFEFNSESLFQATKVNFLAPVELTLKFQSYCDKKDLGLRVLNISTGAATSAIAGWSEYCSSKAAFDLWTRTAYLSPSKRTKYALFYPGVVDTPMQGAIRGANLSEFPDLEKFKGYREAGRLNSPSSVAVAIHKLINANKFGDRVDYSAKELMS